MVPASRELTEEEPEAVVSSVTAATSSYILPQRMREDERLFGLSRVEYTAEFALTMKDVCN